MKISELYEGISPIVYHATQFREFIGILSLNKFQLTPTFTKDVENTNPNYKFYFSTARTRTGRFHLNNSGGTVLIELDGRKLAYNHAGEPIDYFGADFRSYDPNYEQEDRVYSDTNEIDNALSYIKSVDILVNTTISKPSRDFFRIVKELKRLNIPHRIYDNNRDFISGSTKDLSVRDIMARGRDEHYPPYVSRKIDTHDETISAVLKALRFDDLRNFTNKERTGLKEIISHAFGKDALRYAFEAATRERKHRNLMLEISKEMRRLRLFSVDDIRSHIISKFKGMNI